MVGGSKRGAFYILYMSEYETNIDLDEKTEIVKMIVGNGRRRGDIRRRIEKNYYKVLIKLSVVG